jgi:hypothetical protein
MPLGVLGMAQRELIGRPSEVVFRRLRPIPARVVAR